MSALIGFLALLIIVGTVGSLSLVAWAAVSYVLEVEPPPHSADILPFRRPGND